MRFNATISPLSFKCPKYTAPKLPVPILETLEKSFQDKPLFLKFIVAIVASTLDNFKKNRKFTNPKRISKKKKMATPQQILADVRKALSNPCLDVDRAKVADLYNRLSTAFNDEENSHRKDVIVLRVSEELDVKDQIGDWMVAVVKDLRDDAVFVHYQGWSQRYDEWVKFSTERIAPKGTFTDQ